MGKTNFLIFTYLFMFNNKRKYKRDTLDALLHIVKREMLEANDFCDCLFRVHDAGLYCSQPVWNCILDYTKFLTNVNKLTC